MKPTSSNRSCRQESFICDTRVGERQKLCLRATSRLIGEVAKNHTAFQGFPACRDSGRASLKEPLCPKQGRCCHNLLVRKHLPGRPRIPGSRGYTVLCS